MRTTTYTTEGRPVQLARLANGWTVRVEAASQADVLADSEYVWIAVRDGAGRDAFLRAPEWFEGTRAQTAHDALGAPLARPWADRHAVAYLVRRADASWVVEELTDRPGWRRWFGG